MNQADLVKIVRNAYPYPRISEAHAKAIVEAIFDDGITDAMKRGELVRIKNFGTISVTRRPPGHGRNPKTGEEIDYPAKNIARFKAHKALSNALNPAPRVGGRRMSPASGDQRARA
jgi:DNA-binding protein HU-beta